MENIVGKQVNASYKHFLVFSRCFQRFFFLLLNLSQTSRGFYVSANKSFENTAGKGEIALNEQFLLFPQCFLPFWKTFYHFHQTQNCCLQTLSVWKSLKFVVWERVKGVTMW